MEINFHLSECVRMYGVWLGRLQQGQTAVLYWAAILQTKNCK